MAGYWKRPEDTANTLRDGWLHTGDLASMDDDGYFRISGRLKDLILCSGYNVYPDEVDRVIVEHPAVLECATIGVPDEKRGETVKSFIVRQPGAAVTEEQITAWCRERLAAYKVPRKIEFRTELPKSSVLKILRRQLLEEELAGRGK
jgi:long-chain acyl-CoA synthetase